ncbi:MAG TPA: membrane dipeptidase [Candidatus Eisenbacteria bacterium]|nr:membrane dipeptidase [Candidatus Eisenbacteria bacterium]
MNDREKKARSFGSPDARALHEAYPAIDLHDDVLMWARWAGYDLAKRHRPPLPDNRWLGHVDLPRLREGGVGAQFFGLVSLPVFGHGGCFRAVDEQIDILDAFAAEHPDGMRKTRTAEGIERANRDGAVAALLGIEGAHALEGDADRVGYFAGRGVRYLGLSHFSANATCFPAKGRGRDDSQGLTAFGREVVEACIASGVIVDLAHINKKGFMEACAICRVYGAPVIVSHTGVAGAHEHWRNIDDDQLRAVSSTGGVVGVIFVPNFLGGPGTEAVVKHLRHIVSVVGQDHAALGSDYDGMVTPPADLADISMLPNLTDALLGDRWSAELVGKVLRSNVLRVLRDTPVKENG